MRAESASPRIAIAMRLGLMYEISAVKALKMYESTNRDKHMATINLLNGTRVTCRYWSIWGENVSDAECFQRKLAGTLAIDMLE